MTRVHVLNVFTDQMGLYGNPVGVILDGPAIPEAKRQQVAALLGFSETVFVNGHAKGSVRLYTPTAELAFAGHALLGTAELLARCGKKSRALLQPPAGSVPAWREGEYWWLEAHMSMCPPWQHLQVESAAQVAATDAPPDGFDAVQLWAFQDEHRGIVRARVFAPRFGVREDEACGSASMLLAWRLQRPLQIYHGNGSEVLVRPGTHGVIKVGGRVKLHSVFELASR